MRISQTHLRTRGGSSITNSDGKFLTVRSISGLRNKCHRGRELEQNDYDQHNYIHRQNQLADYSLGWGAPASSTTGWLGNENVTQHFIIWQICSLSWHEFIFSTEYIPVRVLISRKGGKKEGKHTMGLGASEGWHCRLSGMQEPAHSGLWELKAKFSNILWASRCRVDSLKLAIVGVFTLWKLANTTKSGLFLSAELVVQYLLARPQWTLKDGRISPWRGGICLIEKKSMIEDKE